MKRKKNVKRKITTILMAELTKKPGIAGKPNTNNLINEILGLTWRSTKGVKSMNDLRGTREVMNCQNAIRV